MALLPSPEEIIEYARTALSRGDGPPTRRDIARAFGIKGPDRAALRGLLKDLEQKGLLSLDGKRAAPRGELPPVLVLDIVDTDEDGDLICMPGPTIEIDPLPRIVLSSGVAAKSRPPLGEGDRFLGRLTELDGSPEGGFAVKPIKVLGRKMTRLLGVFVKTQRGALVEPVNRKGGSAYHIRAGDEGRATHGDLVWIETMNARGHGSRRGRVRDVVGDMAAARNWSLIALEEHGIPIDFPESVLREAETQDVPTIEGREDLRDLPLITIDPADAKDHDDAVYAEKTSDGWRLIVAIADVSWFVRPGSTLDREAERRGNSVYLVDRVVPMLPEVLSNGLCSLKAGEERAVLACEMTISEDGTKKSHRFFRGLMKSAAGLSYEEAQAAADGSPNARAEPLVEPVIKPLWAAYAAMERARARRSPLDLDLPERKILLTKDRQVSGIKIKARFDAHKLIEAMMIAANVCAAETLEGARRELIYRIHDAPDPERLEGLRTYLETLDYSLAPSGNIKSVDFNRILKKARERDEIELVSMAILRAQSQAIYSVDNVGHFGLTLQRYAHFTSPIRRYADLTVHRSLVAAGRLGAGGATAEDEARLGKIAETITEVERRAVAAERATQDRFLAAYLEGEIGATFPARVSGITRAGLFVALDETGADGFVPARSLGGDYFLHDEERKEMVGQHTGGRFGLGQRVEVRLLEVTPLQGGLRFEMLSEPRPGETHKGKKKSPRRSDGPKRGGKHTKKAKSPTGPASLRRRPRKPK